MKDTTRKNSVNDNGTKDFFLSRRNFLKATGGGIIVFFAAGILPAQETNFTQPEEMALLFIRKIGGNHGLRLTSLL